MKNILRYGICLLAITLVSCESWLDVKPADRTSGSDLFSTRQGFVKALNGVYSELTNRNIYGREMTAGIVDIMAQYYDGNSNFYDMAKRYNYTEGQYGYTDIISNIWSKSYNLIVNLNIIIDECGESNKALNGIWHGLIKGEALAMRAFLHLDLLRLFGPTYSADPNGLYIPYVTNTDQAISPLVSSTEIKTLLINDLTTAIALLKTSDPIIENGVMASDASDGVNDLRYRQYRMNYYAAKALLARAYLWFGDTDNAYSTATGLLAEMGETFPFVNASLATQSTHPDRVFSSEIMFAAYDNNREENIYDRYFSPTASYTGNFGEYYIQIAYVGNTKWSGRMSQLFVTENDLRYKAWFGSYTTEGGAELHYFNKYAGGKTNNSYKFRYTWIPLIRISEVYLIAAECATDLEEAKEYLSTLRTARTAYDLESPDRDKLMSNIEWEYRREFLGEGQMYYFYKRRGQAVIPVGESTSETETLQMTQSQYVVPMPDSEADLRRE